MTAYLNNDSYSIVLFDGQNSGHIKIGMKRSLLLTTKVHYPGLNSEVLSPLVASLVSVLKLPGQLEYTTQYLTISNELYCHLRAMLFIKMKMKMKINSQTKKLNLTLIS